MWGSAIMENLRIKRSKYDFTHVKFESPNHLIHRPQVQQFYYHNFNPKFQSNWIKGYVGPAHMCFGGLGGGEGGQIPSRDIPAKAFSSLSLLSLFHSHQISYFSFSTCFPPNQSPDPLS